MAFTIVGLENPKNGVNLRIAIRNSSALGVNNIIYTGDNIDFSKRQDDTEQYKNVPVHKVDCLLKFVPFNTEVILVELTDDAENLESFKHPENAFYIFGNEEKGISKKLLNKGFKKVFINTKLSLNLSSTIGIILYDRQLKQKK